MTDNHTRYQTNYYRQRYLPPLVRLRTEQPCEDAESDCRNEKTGGVRTDSQRTQQLFHTRALFGFHHINTDDGQQHTAGSDKRRRQHGFELHSFHSRSGKRRRAQCHRGEDRTGIRLVEVGTHTGYVTYVIAYVIGDSSRVARVILRDVILRLTDKVGSYICRLGINTTAYAGKKCLRGSTHTKGQHGGRDGDEVSFRPYQLKQTGTVKDKEPTGDVQQRKTHYRQPHHRTRTESHLQTRIQALTRRVSRTSRRICCGLHSEETSQTGEETAGQESEPDDTVLQVKIRHNGKNDSQHHEHNRHDFVLLLEISHRSLAHMRSDGFHQVGAFILAQHRAIEIVGKTER